MTISTRSLPLALLGVGVTLFATQTVAQAPPADFDKYVTSVMTAFEVPGVSVAIVKDGKVVLAKGYGVRKLGDPAPVDAETLFGIASNTKAFTATALGMLVEEGKINGTRRWCGTCPLSPSPIRS
jgi:CubicO group peptidase (beta-lactamase class C family)